MKTAIVRIQIIILVFLIIILGISGCTGKSSKDNQTTGEGIVIEDTESGKDEVLKELSEYPLPTSFEVTKLLIEAGAGYILDLCNPTDNANKYISLKSKALNLGVYGADLSYSATYNQTQETMQFLEVSSKLIDELQISTAFNQDLVTRVEMNIDNVDSLIIIISDSFYETYKYLQENEQDNLSLLILSGSWIEALYITTQISILSTDNKQIVDIIANQKSSLTKLLELLEASKEDDMIRDIYAELSRIKSIYDSAGDTLSEDNLEKLIKASESMRNSII